MQKKRPKTKGKTIIYPIKKKKQLYINNKLLCPKKIYIYIYKMKKKVRMTRKKNEMMQVGPRAVKDRERFPPNNVILMLTGALDSTVEILILLA